ncbi:MAG TPA: hypothetical protein VN682_17875, partial [Terriglobales bacterium]|nr:hypothetical protein [Terriglobales bacterium]
PSCKNGDLEVVFRVSGTGQRESLAVRFIFKGGFSYGGSDDGTAQGNACPSCAVPCPLNDNCQKRAGVQTQVDSNGILPWHLKGHAKSFNLQHWQNLLTSKQSLDLLV